MDVPLSELSALPDRIASQFAEVRSLRKGRLTQVSSGHASNAAVVLEHESETIPIAGHFFLEQEGALTGEAVVTRHADGRYGKAIKYVQAADGRTFHVEAKEELNVKELGLGVWFSSIAFGLLARQFQPLFAGQNVLELGCGVGLGSAHLHAAFAPEERPRSIVSTDYTAHILDLCRDNVQAARAQAGGDEGALPRHATALFDWYIVKDALDADDDPWNAYNEADAGGVPRHTLQDLPAKLPFLWDAPVHTVLCLDCVYKSLCPPLCAVMRYLVETVRVRDILIISPNHREGLDDLHYFLQGAESGTVTSRMARWCKLEGGVVYKCPLRILHWRRDDEPSS